MTWRGFVLIGTTERVWRGRWIRLFDVSMTRAYLDEKRRVGGSYKRKE